MQSQVILWLAALPLVLAMFRAITIGDRLYAPVQQGVAGGHHKQLVNATLAGLTFVGIMLVFIVGAQGPGQFEDPIVLLLFAFTGFVISAYMAAGFRARTWQKFVGHAFHEAGLYWLVLGVCRIFLFFTQRPAQQAGQTQTQPTLAFLEIVIWAVVAAVSLTLIIGTGARMARR